MAKRQKERAMVKAADSEHMSGEVMEAPPKGLATLAIHVRDTSRSPIAGVPVAIRSCQAGVSSFDGLTDRRGRFTQSVKPGEYDICVIALDDEPGEQEVTVVANEVKPVRFQFRQNVSVRRRDHGEVIEGAEVILEADPDDVSAFDYEWTVTGGTLRAHPDCEGTEHDPLNTAKVIWNTDNVRSGVHGVTVSVKRKDTGGDPTFTIDIPVRARGIAHGDILPVSLRRTAAEITDDLPLWFVIRKSTESLAFNNYRRFMDFVLCKEDEPNAQQQRDLHIADGEMRFQDLQATRFMPFTDTDSYRLLKAATEAFLMVNCGVTLKTFDFASPELFATLLRTGVSPGELDLLWRNYLKFINGTDDKTIPYLFLVQDKVRDGRLRDMLPGIDDEHFAMQCYGVVKAKLTNPCLLELIWSYWHEEGMLVQTLGAISRRFQNIRGPADRDPLANLEIDPLRPLSNLLWGYMQDEQHRLTVVRRTYEYDHHYGLRLYGKAVPELRPADSRSRFLEAFHNLLHLCTIYFAQDDDTTVVADAFPVLNALKEVHLLLSEGAHNQFGDLPSTARIEMLMQMWLLARPEFREFLPTRVMVAYPEPWMDRVDAMKRLQGWTDTSVLHFRNLGVFGEQVLLSVRFGNWNDAHDPARAANWARFWRAEIQGYVHAYRAVTGADVSAEPVDSMLPAVHLQRRLAAQGQVGALPAAQTQTGLIARRNPRLLGRNR